VTTGSHSLFQRVDVRFVGINVNAADAHKLSATPIVADAREAIAGLEAELNGWSSSSGYGDDVRARRASWLSDVEANIAPREGEEIGQGEVLRVINDVLGEGDWIVAAAGWQPGDLLKLWDTPAGSFTHIEFGFSCMGHEIPAGLGIRMHEGPEHEVVVVVGDGGYLMNPTELVTSVQEGLKLIVVILDNGGYQSINRLARDLTGSSIGNEFRRRRDGSRILDGDRLRIDYVANARSMGCESALAADGDTLRSELQAAVDRKETTVIVCQTEPHRTLLSSGAFWDLGVPEVATDPATVHLAEQHLTRRQVQRHY
jgi:3D-(3,5/4)-trihydroxycyclohexane-1,2-dione acylhydrolase (decyclizing)